MRKIKNKEIPKISVQVIFDAGLMFRLVMMTAFAILLFAPVFNNVKAQQSQNQFWNPEMYEIAKPSSTPGWVDFKDDIEVNPLTIFIDYKDAFQLGNDDNMVLNKTQNDMIGYTHYRYQQYYKNVKVLDGEYIVHVNDLGHTYSANGKLICGLNLDAKPQVGEETALQTALQHSDGDGYLWLNEHDEAILKEMKNDPNATYYPKGELVIERIVYGDNFSPSNYVLAWKFDIYVGLTGESRSIFINAITGEFVNYLPLSMFCNAGTGPTTWDGTKSFSTSQSGSNYILLDDCTGSHSYTLKTWNLQRTNSSSNAIDYVDVDNNWLSSNDQTGIECHWAMHRTRDYYAFVHSRNSWDGNNGNWVAYNEAVVFGTNNNACFDCFSSIGAFGGGTSSTDPTDDWNTLDIVGHEFTHGVTRTSAGLVYSNESGALNESFSDIFGEMVEMYERGTPDWLVGADRGAIRSFSNPKAHGDPDTYLGTNWYTGSGDNGGVHTNSGVQNHWFYLLSQGGSGTNDNGDNYTVTGIGASAARAIAYRNLTVYLTSNSAYIDARKGALRAARDLYGACSTQEINCGKAWYAVGVGNSLSIYDWQLCGNYTSGFWQGINSVIGGGTCTTNATATSNNVTFTGANEVTLKTGFTATASGSYYFLAYLEPCSYTRWKGDPEAVNEPYGPEAEMTESNIIQRDNSITVFPNPFNNLLKVGYYLTTDESISLVMYDMFGKEIKTIFMNEMEKAGWHQIDVDAKDLAAGVYFITLKTNENVLTKKIVRSK